MTCPCLYVVKFCRFHPTNHTQLHNYGIHNRPLAHKDKEFINTLIAVTSRLDAAVTGINVLNPMENQCCGTFKCMQ